MPPLQNDQNVWKHQFSLVTTSLFVIGGGFTLMIFSTWQAIQYAFLTNLSDDYKAHYFAVAILNTIASTTGLVIAFVGVLGTMPFEKQIVLKFRKTLLVLVLCFFLLLIIVILSVSLSMSHLPFVFALPCYGFCCLCMVSQCFLEICQPSRGSTVQPQPSPQVSVQETPMDIDIPVYDESLPMGWEQKLDQYGRCYYVNHISMQSQWEHPRDQPEVLISYSTELSHRKTRRTEQSIPPHLYNDDV